MAVKCTAIPWKFDHFLYDMMQMGETICAQSLYLSISTSSRDLIETHQGGFGVATSNIFSAALLTDGSVTWWFAVVLFILSTIAAGCHLRALGKSETGWWRETRTHCFAELHYYILVLARPHQALVLICFDKSFLYDWSLISDHFSDPSNPRTFLLGVSATFCRDLHPCACFPVPKLKKSSGRLALHAL